MSVEFQQVAIHQKGVFWPGVFCKVITK